MSIGCKSCKVSCCIASLILLLSAESLRAGGEADYILDEKSHPSSAKEIHSPLSYAFLEKLLEEPLFPGLKETLKPLPPFFRDTYLNVNFRTYYFDRDNQGRPNNKAWAAGGALEYKSGRLFNRIGIGATYYTSQRLRGDKDEGGTLLLKPVQRGFDVLGEAYLEADIVAGTVFRGYRQTFDLPYLNRFDNRMVPNAHEAYIIDSVGTVPNFDFGLGYVRKMKRKNSDGFEYLSEVAGAPGTKKGMAFGGGQYKFNDHFNIGVINYYAFDIFNTLYAEANAIFQLTPTIPLHLSGQFTHQQSVGDELVGDFNTNTGGLKASLSYKGAVFTLAGTKTSENAGVRSPFGGKPSYLSIAVEDFDRAGEDAFLAGFSYDFGRLGFDGLSAYTNYAMGWTPDSGEAASPDQQEWDVTIDLRPKFKLLQGAWLRLRRAHVSQDGANNDLTEYRVILNYEIPIL